MHNACAIMTLIKSLAKDSDMAPFKMQIPAATTDLPRIIEPTSLIGSASINSPIISIQCMG